MRKVVEAKNEPKENQFTNYGAHMQRSLDAYCHFHLDLLITFLHCWKRFTCKIHFFLLEIVFKMHSHCGMVFGVQCIGDLNGK